MGEGSLTPTGILSVSLCWCLGKLRAEAGNGYTPGEEEPGERLGKGQRSHHCLPPKTSQEALVVSSPIQQGEVR